MFHWDDLKFFLAMYRARSASQAALALGVSTSTVTRRLAILEEQLGAVLFARTPEGLAPTAEADAVARAAMEVERAAAEIELVADGSQREPSGQVRIACTPDVAHVVLIPALAVLRARYPRVTVSLASSTEIADLSRREADLALRSTRPETGELVGRRLRDVPFGIFGTTDVIALLDGELTVATASRAPWISLDTRLDGVPEARWLAEALPLVEPVVRGTSLTEVRLMAMAGLGLAILPRVLAGAVPRLVEAPWPAHAPPLNGALWLVGHTVGRRTPRVRAVWDFLAELCGEADGIDDEGARQRELRSRYMAAYHAA